MKKKICLVSHTLQMGGMERVMAEFANYLSQKDDLEVYLILLLKGNRFYAINDRITVIEPDFNYSKKYRYIYLLKIMYWLRKNIKIINPVTILSFGEYWNSVMLIATFGLKIPKYISDRSKPTINWKGFNEFVRKITYRTATGFIAQTMLSSSIIKKRYKIPKTIVVGNPIRNIENPIAKDRKNLIINVGRLIEYKQQNKLINIFSNLSNTDNWKLIILGDGPLRKPLENQIKNLNLKNKVILYGSVKDVDKYLIKSKIFAFTSYYEGFPNALAEAMMAGCACISFDCESGPSDLISNGINGYLIPLNDEALYIEKLQQLINNQEIIDNFQEAAYLSIQQYSANTVHEKTLNFILS